MGFFEKLFGKEKEEVVTDVEPVVETITVPVVECDCKTRQKEYLDDVDMLNREVKSLRKERKKAVEDLEKLKLQKKIEIEDIKHMQKILDEQNSLTVDRAEFEAEKKAETEIKSIRKEYADKLEKELLTERKKMQDVMEKVMAALPNVNVRLKGEA